MDKENKEKFIKIAVNAERIAEELDLPTPDFDNFKETSEFINENKDDYFESKRLRRHDNK